MSSDPSSLPAQRTRQILEELRQQGRVIAAELARSHSSLRSVAEALGVPRKTLHDKLRKHGLNFADAAQHHADELD